jgi:AbiU2
MRKEQSLKEIAKMAASARFKLARAKLSNDNSEGLVPALLNHLRLHENTRWLIYSPHLADQIPKSRAAHAFASLQMSSLHYEIIRLCTFWDPVDLDSRSIPTVVALADCPEVSKYVYDDHYMHYERHDEALAKDWGNKARRRLRDGVRGALEIERSDILRHTRNFRDKLAHQLERTAEEKRGPVPPPLYGDERKLLGKTVTTVNRLYLSLNGTGFAWDSAKRMHKRNAKAFWKGAKFNVLR